jgi:radical SAM protein with 4Fe4S-binding SPASM domain
MSAYARATTFDGAGLWRDRSPVLTRVDVELTERCNNACKHCFINRAAADRDAKKAELSADEIEAFLGDAAELGALTVRFTGGEPLLRGDFERIYLAARRAGLQVHLTTNACLVTPSLADLFARVPPRAPIQISVYGVSAASYGSVSTVPGSFANFRRGVRLLLEREVPVALTGTALPETRAEAAQLEAWSQDLGIPEAVGWVALLYLRGRRDDEGKNDLIRGLRLDPREVVPFLKARRGDYLEDLRDFCRHYMSPPGEVLFDCGAGMAVCLSAYGELHACQALRAPETTYDWRDGTLRAAMAAFFPTVRARRATDPDYLQRCARCFLSGLCEQCPAWSWMENGVLDRPVDYLCQVAHAQARALRLLDEGERSWEIGDWEERKERLELRMPPGGKAGE